MAGVAATQLGLSINAIGDSQSAQAQAGLAIKGKAKAAAEDFEAMFLNSMFQQMFTGINGEGPFGGSGAAQGGRRSLLTDQYAKTFAQNGGVGGIASHVYDALLKQQGVSAS